MADKITEGTILAIGFEYTGDDEQKRTTYLKIPNPKGSVMTESWIKQQAQQLISGENPILLPNPDYTSDPFDSSTAIFTAYTENTRTIDYDIGIEN